MFLIDWLRHVDNDGLFFEEGGYESKARQN